MAVSNLRQLYVEELKDLYSAEAQNLTALRKMAKAASSPELQTAFAEHCDETERQIGRLEQILRKMRQTPSGRKCEGMQGIIAEGNDMLSERMDADTRDAALIANAQRVEHYEMAGYGTARNFARVLGDEEAAKLLQRTLDEEWESDRHLTLLAESFINRSAASAPSA